MRRLHPSYAEAAELVSEYAYPRDRLWVRANMVCSVDGSAVVDGRSEGLSGPADKKVFGVLRGLCDVVLVGAGTARAEGYRAPSAKATYGEARASAGQRPAPVLALVSRSLDLDPTSALFSGPEPTIVVTTESASSSAAERLGDSALLVVSGEDQVDIGSALDQLAALGLSRVLCEGGPQLLAGVIAAGRLDELCATVSPQLVGGDGVRMLAGRGPGAPVRLRLAHLLEEDDHLFTRYLVAPA
jgi:riboflavin biosynthesis pyrimidine reductase